jgi:adenylate kinase
MKPTTVVFLGKSGSGKGTQAALLVKTFERVDPLRKALYVETGQKFRNYIETSTSVMAKKIKEVMMQGKFLPPFIPIWSWTQFLADEFLTGEEHLIFDGVCRQPEEAPILDKALQFLGCKEPVVILLDVHHKIVTDRLLKRGRFDDKHEKIQERLHVFETQAMPAVDYFKQSKNAKFVVVDGDQSIEKVHEDVLKALGIEGRL